MPGMHETSAVLTPLSRPETTPVSWRGGAPLFSSQLTSTSSATWPASYTQPAQRSSAALATWPAIPDSYARWPAKGPPSATLTKFPKRLVFRVEPVGLEVSKCVVCGGKLPKNGAQVLMKQCEGFRLQGYRCVGCVKPHTLRQAGGGAMVEMDPVHSRSLTSQPSPFGDAPPSCPLRRRFRSA